MTEVDGAGLLASVIVPVRAGDARALPGLLAALRAQTIPTSRFEVVVADDGSTEGIEPAGPDEAPSVRVSAGPPLGSNAARNRAARLARAPILAFCDADCLPEPGWLESGLAALHDAGLVAGAIRRSAPARATIWTLLDIDSFLDQRRAVRGGVAVTANLFVRASLYRAVGGLDESLHYYGDYDFALRCRAAGARLVFGPSAVVIHPTIDDARTFLRKVWATNASYGWSEGRRSRRPDALRLREWIPLVQTVRARRRAGRPIRVERSRLAESGVRPALRRDTVALLLQYLALPYVARVAQVAGWRAARAGRANPDSFSPTRAAAA